LVICFQKRTKVLCALLSLPTPESPNPGGQVNGAVDRVISGYLEQIGLCKVLLVGNDQSGTSTVYKQVSCLLIIFKQSLPMTMFFLNY